MQLSWMCLTCGTPISGILVFEPTLKKLFFTIKDRASKNSSISHICLTIASQKMSKLLANDGDTIVFRLCLFHSLLRS